MGRLLKDKEGREPRASLREAKQQLGAWSKIRDRKWNLPFYRAYPEH